MQVCEMRENVCVLDFIPVNPLSECLCVRYIGKQKETVWLLEREIVREHVGASVCVCVRAWVRA